MYLVNTNTRILYRIHPYTMIMDVYQSNICTSKSRRWSCLQTVCHQENYDKLIAHLRTWFGAEAELLLGPPHMSWGFLESDAKTGETWTLARQAQEGETSRNRFDLGALKSLFHTKATARANNYGLNRWIQKSATLMKSGQKHSKYMQILALLIRFRKCCLNWRTSMYGTFCAHSKSKRCK